MDNILYFTVQTNFILFFFNLVPAPPLDGGQVAEGLMPYKHRKTFENYARFGPFVVMAVALIPQLAQIFRVPAHFVTTHLYHLLFSIFGL
jgi:Zn-dependent protease